MKKKKPRATVSSSNSMFFMFSYLDIQWMTLFLSLVGKFGITVGFAVVYVYAVELFPTVMRNSALGLCSFTGRIGGILAPYIGDLVSGEMMTVMTLIQRAPN